MNPVVAKVLKKTLTTSATVVGALVVVYFWNLDQKYTTNSAPTTVAEVANVFFRTFASTGFIVCSFQAGVAYFLARPF